MPIGPRKRPHQTAFPAVEDRKMSLKRRKMNRQHDRAQTGLKQPILHDLEDDRAKVVRFQCPVEVKDAMQTSTSASLVQDFMRAAQSFRKTGYFDEAIEMYHEAIRSCHGNLATTTTILRHLGNLYNNTLHDLNNAKQVYLQELELERFIHPLDHPDIIVTLRHLATVHQRKGDYKQALTHFHEARCIQEKHGRTEYLHEILCDIALVHFRRLRFVRALRWYQRAVALRRRMNHEHDLTLANTLNSIGWVYYHLDRFSEAISSFCECLRIRLDRFGRIHSHVAAAYYNVAVVKQKIGLEKEALRILEYVLRVEISLLGPKNPSLIPILNRLIDVCKSQGETPKIERYLALILDIELDRGIDYGYPLISQVVNHYLQEANTKSAMRAMTVMARCYPSMPLEKPVFTTHALLMYTLGKLYPPGAPVA